MHIRSFPGMFALRYPYYAPEDDTGGAPAAEPAAEEAPATEEPAAEPEPAAAEAAPAAEAAAEPEEEAKPTRVPWQVKRIAELTAREKAAQEERDAANERAREANERAQAYEALYGRPEGAPAATPAATPATSPSGERVYTQTEFQEQVARVTALNVLNQKCETLFETGAKAHGAEWNKRIGEVGQAFGPELQKRPDFFEAITALSNGADVYLALAGDLDQLDEVLNLPPVKLGMRLAELSAKAATKPAGRVISKLEEPIEPIDGNGGVKEVDLAKVPMDDYVKAREKQRAERFAARN